MPSKKCLGAIYSEKYLIMVHTMLCALWNAAGARHADLSARMEEALPHAAGAMLATSSTTAAAFFANGISSLPPVRLFRIFMWYIT